MNTLIGAVLAALVALAPQCDPNPAPPPFGHAVASAPDAPVELDGCDELHWYRAQWGLPAAFDGLMYRESRCTADETIRTSCCVGPLQLYARLFLRDARMRPIMHTCGVSSEYDIDGPQTIELKAHFCVAAGLFAINGYRPWSL